VGEMLGVSMAGVAAAGRVVPQAGSEQARDQGQGLRAWPWAVVAATVGWSLWELRATVASAQYLDDSSVHEQMVRFATARIAAGHDPLTSWFPYLGLGSPHFLHYQSVPAIVTGLAGLVTGPDAAFRWSLYLLWCLWPVAVYASARVLGLARPAAAAAGVVAPLLHSVPGIGYEQHAYLWAGFGGVDPVVGVMGAAIRMGVELAGHDQHAVPGSRGWRGRRPCWPYRCWPAPGWSSRC